MTIKGLEETRKKYALHGFVRIGGHSMGEDHRKPAQKVRTRRELEKVANLRAAVQLDADQLDLVVAHLDRNGRFGEFGFQGADPLREMAPMSDEAWRRYLHVMALPLLVSAYPKIIKAIEHPPVSASKPPAEPDGPWVRAAKLGVERGMDMAEALEDFDVAYRDAYITLEALREKNQPAAFADAQAELADIGRARTLLGATSPPAPQSVVPEPEVSADTSGETGETDAVEARIARLVERAAAEQEAGASAPTAKDRKDHEQHAAAALDAAQAELERYADTSTPAQVAAMCERLGIEPPAPDVEDDAPEPLTPGERIEAVLAGDVSHLAEMPDVELIRTKKAAFLKSAPAEVCEAIRQEWERREAAFLDVPSGDGAQTAAAEVAA